MQTRINLLVQLIAVILTLICIESHFAITSAFLVPAFPFFFSSCTYISYVSVFGSSCYLIRVSHKAPVALPSSTPLYLTVLLMFVYMY